MSSVTSCCTSLDTLHCDIITATPTPPPPQSSFSFIGYVSWLILTSVCNSFTINMRLFLFHEQDIPLEVSRLNNTSVITGLGSLQLMIKPFSRNPFHPYDSLSTTQHLWSKLSTRENISILVNRASLCLVSSDTNAFSCILRFISC